MKVAVIGGGSTYTPELMEGLIRQGAALDISEVSLQDIDSERLSVVGGFCERMRVHARAPFGLSVGQSLPEALEGADFVLTQVRVGGQAGRHKDIQLGLRHGLVGQETTGVGGFAKALRTIPVILDVCREMEKRCPRAWLINFTNPSGLVTEAVLKHGRERAIGLCNIPIHLQRDLAAYLGVEPARVEIHSIGLNHLSWVRRIMLDGRDVLPEALEKFSGLGCPANMPEELDYPPGFLQKLGMIPSSYLRFYYQTPKVVDELKNKTRSRAQEVMEVERELLASYRDPNLREKPKALQKRGGAYYSLAAVELMAAIHLDRGERHVVNLKNAGAIACLPDDCVVEIPARVDASGAHALGLDPPPPEIRGLMQQVKAYEELAVQAAVFGSRRSAELALVAHPLVGDVELAAQLVDEIAAEHGMRFKQEGSE